MRRPTAAAPARGFRCLEDGCPLGGRFQAVAAAGDPAAEAGAHRAAYHAPPGADVPPEYLGPCAACRAPTVRYGPAGEPLCPACRA